jgi:archaellum component FlaC
VLRRGENLLAPTQQEAAGCSLHLR